MRRPKGHNLKYFYNDEAQVIRRATASVSNSNQKLGFNVPTDKIAIIKQSLGALVAVEWDTETYGTWLDVLGINNIKSALLKLKNDNLISEDFYNSVAKNFPKPGSGTIDLLEQDYPAYNLKRASLYESEPTLSLSSSLNPAVHFNSTSSIFFSRFCEQI